MAPSPMTQTTLCFLPARSRATAMPSPAEIEVEEWPAPNVSYSLSSRLQKPDRPPPMAQGADAVAPPGQDLVRIGLVADVPDELVVRRVEHFVQRDGELDHAKACAKMAAGHRDRVDGLLAKLGRELRQVMVVQGPQILGSAHPVKQRRWMFGAHTLPAETKGIGSEFAFL